MQVTIRHGKAWHELLQVQTEGPGQVRATYSEGKHTHATVSIYQYK